MNKRVWALPVLVALLLAAGSGVGFAIPSLGGPTGIVSLPTAEIAPQNQLQTALSYQKFTVTSVVESTGMYGQPAAAESSDDFTSWSLQALAAVTKEAELWAAYSSVKNSDDTSVWGIGGKVQLTKESEQGADVAIGASFQSATETVLESIGMYGESQEVSIDVDVDVWKAYLVATKDFAQMKGEMSEGARPRMLGSLGLLYLKVNASASAYGVSVSEDESLTRPFVGFEFVQPPATSLGLEYRWSDDKLDSKAVFSAVLRQQLSPEVTAEIGTTNADPLGLGLDDQNIFVRVGYSFPLKGY